MSYHCDILFRVIDIKEQGGKKIAILFGEDIRLVADAPCEDLIVINQAQRMKFEQEFRSLEEQSFQLFRQDVA
ncbi:sporulation peptidase YabG, partial [Shouchella clausii]